MIRLGLSSQALLTCDAKRIIAVAASSGVDAIEWAGEVHVPHDDLAVAEGAMMETLRAGLTIASYATLYRASGDGEAGLRIEALLRAAEVLQAPLVRVFLGGQGSAQLAGNARARLVDEARRLGDRAAVAGRTICLSFGRNTSLDRYSKALDLVSEIGHPFVRLAWEALPGVGCDEATAALEAAGSLVSLIVARNIEPDGAVGSLASEEEAWRRRLLAFKRRESDPKMSSFIVIGAVREHECASEGALPGLVEDVALLRRLIGELEGNKK